MLATPKRGAKGISLDFQKNNEVVIFHSRARYLSRCDASHILHIFREMSTLSQDKDNSEQYMLTT
jgi:hypothetical protein